MPALQPAMQPDKAMTLDLAALQRPNGAATTYSAPAPADTDFSEPTSQSAAAPSQSAAAATAPSVAQPSGPPQNWPWGTWQSSWPQASGAGGGPPGGPPAQMSAPANGGAGMPMPSEIPQSQPQSQGAPAVLMSNGAPAATSGNATESELAAPTAQRKCFTNAEGVKICYIEDVQHYNNTDVHKEGGVNDYHNENSAHGKAGIQGKVSGNNVTDSLNHVGEHSPSEQHKNGITSFQGKTEKNQNNEQNIHKDQSGYSKHDSKESDLDSDWKSAFKGSDGSKEMSEINEDGQIKDVEDTKVDADGKDKVDVEESKGSEDHRFMSDKPGTENDSSLTWDEDTASKKQSQEFQGKGVYDYHEESSSSSRIKASVDGDQGWEQFEQNMDDFDTAFDNDAEWKAKLEDPRYHGASNEMVKRQSSFLVTLLAGQAKSCKGGDEGACNGLRSELSSIEPAHAKGKQSSAEVANHPIAVSVPVLKKFVKACQAGDKVSCTALRNMINHIDPHKNFKYPSADKARERGLEPADEFCYVCPTAGPVPMPIPLDCWQPCGNADPLQHHAVDLHGKRNEKTGAAAATASEVFTVVAVAISFAVFGAIIVFGITKAVKHCSAKRRFDCEVARQMEAGRVGMQQAIR